jgi:hypothetical protein
MTPSTEPDVDPRLLHALADPVRHEVLTEIAVTPGSVSGVAASLSLPVEEVRGHVEELIASDALEPIDDRTGPDERRYRAMIRPFLDDDHWVKLSRSQRQELFGLTLRGLTRRFDDALAAGQFGHVQSHVSLTRLLLDDQGWQELADLLAGVLEEAMQIEADCCERSARSPGREMFAANLAVLYFGRPDGGRTGSTDEKEM